MELDADLIGLQGILISVQKNINDFVLIKYAVGHEWRIEKITEVLHQYFTLKQFLKNDVIDRSYDKQLTKITYFFIINTQFRNKNLLETKECSHLINAIPTLSVCVCANIIFELDLATYCCSVITTLPMQLCEQLFRELIICLKFGVPKKSLQNTCIFLDKLIEMISNCEINDDLVKLTDFALEMLDNVSKIDLNVIPSMKTSEIYELKGHVLLHLLKLLCKCPIEMTSLSKIINKLIEVCMPILKSITIMMYCFWDEILYNDESLQNVISHEAYSVTEHLREYKLSQEFLQVLSSIGQKPETLEEIIAKSNVVTIIENINKCNEDQIHWFNRFMKLNVFESKKTKDCLNKWAHLCTVDNASHMIRLPCETNETKALVFKCIEHFSVKELTKISMDFTEVGWEKFDMGSVNEELKILLNKLESDSELDDDFIKKMFLLLLQNRTVVVDTVIKECLKNSFYTKSLREVFKNCITIMDVPAEMLIKDLLRIQKPDSANFLNYGELFNTLVSLNYFRKGVILFGILFYLLNDKTEEEEMVLYTLKVLNFVDFIQNPYNNSSLMLDLIIMILRKYRCQFFTFNNLHQEITQEAINSISKFHTLFSRSFCTVKELFQRFTSITDVDKYHIEFFRSSVNILHYTCPAFSIENYPEAVTKLMKVLQICVSTEWISITKQLESELGNEKTLKLLTDILILLCQITKTQMDNNQSVISGLKYYLQQYGIVIKDVLQPKYKTIEDELVVTKSVCRLLKEIPDEVRKVEGLGLTRLLSDRSLQSLKQDKAFIISIISIGDSTISKVLSDRISS